MSSTHRVLSNCSEESQIFDPNLERVFPRFVSRFDLLGNGRGLASTSTSGLVDPLPDYLEGALCHLTRWSVTRLR